MKKFAILVLALLIAGTVMAREDGKFRIDKDAAGVAPGDISLLGVNYYLHDTASILVTNATKCVTGYSALLYGIYLEKAPLGSATAYVTIVDTDTSLGTGTFSASNYNRVLPDLYNLLTSSAHYYQFDPPIICKQGITTYTAMDDWKYVVFFLNRKD